MMHRRRRPTALTPTWGSGIQKPHHRPPTPYPTTAQLRDYDKPRVLRFGRLREPIYTSYSRPRSYFRHVRVDVDPRSESRRQPRQEKHIPRRDAQTPETNSHRTSCEKNIQLQREAQNAEIERRLARRHLGGYSRSNSVDSAGKHVRFNSTVETFEEKNISGDGLEQEFGRLRLDSSKRAEKKVPCKLCGRS